MLRRQLAILRRIWSRGRRYRMASEKVGDVWVTKKVEAETFDDKSYQLQRLEI